MPGALVVGGWIAKGARGEGLLGVAGVAGAAVVVIPPARRTGASQARARVIEADRKTMRFGSAGRLTGQVHYGWRKRFGARMWFFPNHACKRAGYVNWLWCGA